VTSDGVLLVAHGTVSNLDDLPAFLARIRRGRPAPAGLVEELRHRYETIGGSPLLELTRAQAGALERQLGLPVLVGMRLWEPGIESALRAATSRGIERLCVLPLAPYSVHVYWDAALRSRDSLAGELEGRAPELVSVAPYGAQAEFVAAHAERIRSTLETLPNADSTTLVLTAHSLPSAVIRGGDPYETLVAESARAIGRTLERDFVLAFQSQGEGGGDWLGPALRPTLERLRDEGRKQVVLAPFGFLSEHVETLYDLDVEARAWAKELELSLTRVPALNDDPGLIRALASVARRALASG
jgi:ferrochelatase